MDANSSAHKVLEVLEVFSGLAAYAAYRLLLIPRLFERSNDPPLSITNESAPETSDGRNSGQLLFSVLAILLTFFFLNIAGGDVRAVMAAHLGWGVFVILLVVGLLWMIATIELIHRKDNKYIDLLSEPDEETAAASRRHDQRTISLIKWYAVLWFVLFACAAIWLWLIAV